MKSKVLIGALAVLLAIGMVSCSMDEYAKLGEAMGKMGSNVYGIEPNMTEVTATVGKVDSSVDYDEDGKATIDTSGAADLISSLAEIKNSSQKTDAIKEELSKPVSEEKADAVKKALESEISKVVNDYRDSVTIPEGTSDEIKKAYESVSNALNDIKDRIESTEVPTKADLATITIVKNLADTVKEVAKNSEDYTKEKLIEKANDALQSLDALKVATEAAGLEDLLNDIDISSLWSSPKPSKAIAKEREESDSDKMTELFSSAIDRIASMMIENGKFNEKKYNRVMFQLSAMRTVYETTAWFAMPVSAEGFGSVALISNNGVGLNKFSVNDALLYVVSFAFTEANNLWPVTDEADEVSFMSVIKAYVNAEDDDARFEVLDKLPAKANCQDSIIEGLKDRLVTGVNTAAVILSDARYIDSIKNFAFEDADNITTDLTNYFDELLAGLKGTQEEN